jgi:hypothetical protein
MASKQNTGIQQGEYVSFLNSVPTVGELDYVPSFIAQDLDLKYLDKNQDDFLKVLDKQRDDAKKGFDAITEAQDKILKLRADNPYQSQTIDNLKAGSGFDNTLFDLKEADFENPFKVKEIESRAARMLTNPDYLNILRDQTYHDTFNKDLDANVCAGKNANSALCKMGREELKKYLSDEAGAYRGGELRAADFTPLDWMKVLKDDLDKVPIESFMGDVMDGNGYLMVEQLEKRGKELVSSLIKNRTNDKQFANNLYADGFINEASVEKLKQDLVNAWTQQTVKKFEFKLKPRPAQTPVWLQQAQYANGLYQQAVSGTGFRNRFKSIMDSRGADGKVKFNEKVTRIANAENTMNELGDLFDAYDLNSSTEYANKLANSPTSDDAEAVFGNMVNDLLYYGEAKALKSANSAWDLSGSIGDTTKKALAATSGMSEEQLAAFAESSAAPEKLKMIYKKIKGLEKIKGTQGEIGRIFYNLNLTANGGSVPKQAPSVMPQAPSAPKKVANTGSKTTIKGKEMIWDNEGNYIVK